MKIALLAAWLSRASGGLAYSVPRLATELKKRTDISVTIFGSIDPKYRDDWREWPDPTFALRIFGPAWFAWAPGTLHSLQGLAPDVVDAQGLWVYPSLASLSYARRSGKPYVVTPRGMLDPWTLDHSRWKKRLASAWFEADHLQKASCLRATAQAEVRHFRTYGLKNPVAVVPNGVDFPQRRDRQSSRRKTVLFLSRLHPKKGIDYLLRVWARVSRNAPEWQLVIAGPDELDHRAAMQSLASQLDLHNLVWREAVYGDEKTLLYHSADLFVLPTHAENFGLVVAEALAHEVPVITTTNAPWDGLKRHCCGWWIDLSDEALAMALHEAMSMTDAERRAMGARGRAWMERDFAWPAIAAQMHELYAWVLGGGSPPSFVVTD